MNIEDRPLIEDVIPIEVISKESASEKVGGRLRHPSTLHLWWARRPLAASRVAVYATLVAAEGSRRTQEEESQFSQGPLRMGRPVGWDRPCPRGGACRQGGANRPRLSTCRPAGG